MSRRYHRESPNRNRLYRNPDRAILAGVCAGIADWLGLNLTALRVIVILLAIPFTAVMIIGYLVLWVLVPKQPIDLYRDDREEAFWHEVRRSPSDSVSRLNRRFRDLDDRLREMEAWMTSSEFRIDRELRDR